MSGAREVVVSGGFDNIRSHDLRFLEEAAKLGRLTVLLWPDELLYSYTGKLPKFLYPERRYVLDAIRYVDEIVDADPELNADELPANLYANIWADHPPTASPRRRKHCEERGMSYHRFRPDQLAGFPEPLPTAPMGGRKKVVVTGSFDWLHSGHVRFFEEVSEYGDLYVFVGHDANIRLLKGEGHPLQPQDERQYAVSSIRYVKEAMISTGSGWLDAEPEIEKLKPDIYAVNEDGDQGGKRDYCRANGIGYLVLSRRPAPGLPRRSSTDLRVSWLGIRQSC